MPGIVYLLCAGTSLICSLLLLRGFRRNRVRLLLWSGLCFAALAIDNSLLYLDLIVIPDVPLMEVRRLPGLIGMSLLMFGLVWESK